jgi:hypothetical protein
MLAATARTPTGWQVRAVVAHRSKDMLEMYFVSGYVRTV